MSELVYQPSQTTHWRNLFESKTMLLGSHNLNEGEELVGQIQSVAVQEIRNQNGKKEKVPVVNFFNAPPMVLNITNTRTIASLYGDSYEGWANKHIQIFATKVKAFGQEQMALRIRQIKPSVGEDVSAYEAKLNNCQNLNELQSVFMSLPKHLKTTLTPLKDQLKGNLSA